MRPTKQITTATQKPAKRIDGNKLFNVPITAADNQPPPGMPAGMPTMGEYRDSAALGVMLDRLVKRLGW